MSPLKSYLEQNLVIIYERGGLLYRLLCLMEFNKPQCSQMTDVVGNVFQVSMEKLREPIKGPVAGLPNSSGINRNGRKCLTHAWLFYGEAVMQNELFILILGTCMFLFLGWGFRSLTGEGWQIAAAAPKFRVAANVWSGTNYTYYGVFQTLAFVVSAALLRVMVSALDAPFFPLASLILIGSLAVLCFSAATITAQLVEKKKHTLTVGGAFFIGLLVAPWLIAAVNRITTTAGNPPIPSMPLLAAGVVAYAIGKGLGRLACISFGCCYGKPLSSLHPLLQRLFRRHNFVFHGKTKKIAYEAGLDRTQVVPIQAMTSIFLVLTGLGGIYLFLNSFYSSAFLLAVISTQTWRYVSEMFRADYRGAGRISAYQVMSLIAIAYAFALWAVLPNDAAITSHIVVGVRRLWDPGTILTLQVIGVAVFFYTGRSKVTEASLSFHVRQDRV